MVFVCSWNTSEVHWLLEQMSCRGYVKVNTRVSYFLPQAVTQDVVQARREGHRGSEVSWIRCRVLLSLDRLDDERRSFQIKIIVLSNSDDDGDVQSLFSF